MTGTSHDDHRLRRRADFQQIYNLGRKSTGRFVVIFCRPREDDGPWRLGLTATRKIGPAVDRNRARRRAREFFRRRAAYLPNGWDFVVNLRRGAIKVPAPKLARDLTQRLHELGMTDVPETLESMMDPETTGTSEV